MAFDEIREHFLKLMPADLCKSSVNFFDTVEQKEALVAHLKKYAVWSINQGLITRENVERLGEDFANENGIFVDEDIAGATIFGSSGFVFGCHMDKLSAVDQNPFIYLKNSQITVFEVWDSTKSVTLLQGNGITEIEIIGQVDVLRVYNSTVDRLHVLGSVGRLVIGKGGAISKMINPDKIKTIIEP